MRVHVAVLPQSSVAVKVTDRPLDRSQLSAGTSVPFQFVVIVTFASQLSLAVAVVGLLVSGRVEAPRVAPREPSAAAVD